MEKNQQVITIAFVFIIGLLGGYMIAQHTGHAAESHEAMHEQGEHDQSRDDYEVSPPGPDMPAPQMEGGAAVDVQPQ